MVNPITAGSGRMMNPFALLLSTIALFPNASLKESANAKETSKPIGIESQLSSLSKADIWFNSKPITAAKLKGKVVLVEFCTYTCINWLRTLPYVRAWDKKYKDQGLVVIAVHTPEFPFEKNIDNIRRSVTAMKIEFPIAVDNDYNIWNAFNNQYWPAIYLVDAKGRIAYHRFGEGGYEETEKSIQELLQQAGAKDVDHDPLPVSGDGLEAAADWTNLNSQENYLGYYRTEGFSARGGVVQEKPSTYNLPANVRLNQWALAGNWTMRKQSVVLNNPNGKIVYRFHARDLHLVMGPASAGSKIRFRVSIDGKPPGTDHGTDIDEQGNGTLSEQRLYQLVRQNGSIVDHTFEIEFSDAGAEAFSFTFG